MSSCLPSSLVLSSPSCRTSPILFFPPPLTTHQMGSNPITKNNWIHFTRNQGGQWLVFHTYLATGKCDQQGASLEHNPLPVAQWVECGCVHQLRPDSIIYGCVDVRFVAIHTFSFKITKSFFSFPTSVLPLIYHPPLSFCQTTSFPKGCEELLSSSPLLLPDTSRKGWDNNSAHAWRVDCKLTDYLGWLPLRHNYFALNLLANKDRRWQNSIELKRGR